MGHTREGRRRSDAVNLHASIAQVLRVASHAQPPAQRRCVDQPDGDRVAVPPSVALRALDRVPQALAALDDGQREVTVLHIWGELTFAEIGEVLGVSPNTAASRYRYALARLREAMCAKEDCHAEP